MTVQIQPTPQGLKRYPQTAGYNAELSESIACTCNTNCWPCCAGECGCEACRVQFALFCDDAGFAWEAEEVPPEALVAYRGAPDDMYYGEHLGVRYSHRYDSAEDARTGIVHLAPEAKTIKTAGVWTDSWVTKAHELIDALYRERPDQLDIRDPE